MGQFEKKDKNKIIRGAKRAIYDKVEIFNVLDAGFICHISFVINGEPMLIPTAYGRDGETIYVHGSIKSRMINVVKKGIPICMAVTHLDGLVLARSAFHHSVNYRSAILFGNAEEVITDEEKSHALYLITENMMNGRWDEVRKPSQKELDITSVLKFKIESASAKIRSGDPVDDKSDYDLAIWAGVLPLRQGYQEPITDKLLNNNIELSNATKLAWQSTNK
jgi:nitroimidazol reductase NimA-like FMN-containing flavoprotein (pyridoxamine 5'-phosphate oxidase superfamily)